MKTLLLNLSLGLGLVLGFQGAAHAADPLPGDLADPLCSFLDGSLRAVVTQPDGKIIISGSFTSVNGQPRKGLARLDANGALDSFDPSPDGLVSVIAVQPDGKILIGGLFTSLQPNGATSPVTRYRVARLETNGDVDTSFDLNANSFVSAIALQSDGKIIVGGAFTTLQPLGYATAVGRARVARINTDGTVDMSFDPHPNNSVLALAVQPDGKVVLGGAFTELQANGAPTVTRNRIARVHPDGSLDSGFNPNANNTVVCIVTQPDGRVLVSGAFSTLNPNGTGAVNRGRVARFNSDGSLDISFDPMANNNVNAMALQADGKIVIGGLFTQLQPNGASSPTTRSRLARVLPNGALDPGFDPSADNTVYALAIESNGSVLAGGSFLSLQPNGGSATPRSLLARLWNDPATQTLSTPTTTSVLWQRGGCAAEALRAIFEVSTDGGSTWTLLGDAVRVGSSPDWRLTGLGLPASGYLRARAQVVASTNSCVGWVQQVDDFGAPGSLDMTYAPGALGSAVIGVAVQPDRKVVIGGRFNTAGSNSLTRQNIARLNVDGTADAWFDPRANNDVWNAVVQPDGKIIICGFFTSLQPNGGASFTRVGIARLNADGTVDAGFDPNPDNVVYALSLQPDGKILIGGGFSSLRPNGALSSTPRNCIARLNSDGTLDTTFDPNANGNVMCFAVDRDGKVLFGGSFTSVQPNGAPLPTTRNRIARVNVDGTLDTTFDPNANSDVRAIIAHPTGRVIFAGAFTTVQPNGAPAPTTRNRMAQVYADGSLEDSFDPNLNHIVWTLALQADQKILVGGYFTSLQPRGALGSTTRNHVVRLRDDGTLDTGFDPNANNEVTCIALQSDGRPLLAGMFTAVQGTSRNHIARVHNSAAPRVLKALGTNQLRWVPDGAAPHMVGVEFDQSTDAGLTWTSLGKGELVGFWSDWQLTGLSLPNGCLVRARGVVVSGYNNAGSGVIEQTMIFAPDISVSGNDVVIADGDTFVSGANDTDFGSVAEFGGTSVHTFTLSNVGAGPLALTSTPRVIMSGPHAADFTVTTQPPATLAAGESGTFVITFDPSASGVRTAMVTIANDDPDEGSFTFAIQGNGLSPGQLAFADTVFSVLSSASATTADISIGRSGGTLGDIGCALSTTNGTAVAPTHYTAQSNAPIALADGVTSGHLLIPIAANATTTTTKMFTATLSNASGGSTLVAPTTATVVILPPSAATDAVKPAVTIASPVANALVNDTTTLQIQGSATDNIGVRRVQVSIDGGTTFVNATLATPGATSSTWSHSITPVTGTNTILFRSLDFNGNTSAVVTRTFTQLRTLTVSVSGPANSGSVTTGFVPTSSRQVGKSYTITATPKTGFVFDGWTANNWTGTNVTGVANELPVLTFTMTEGLTLTAHFIANPFTPSVIGTFNGLITPLAPTAASNETTGLLQTAVVLSTGTFTSTVKIDGLSKPVNGLFDNAGDARFGTARSRTLLIARTNKPSLEVALHLDMTAVQRTITGTVRTYVRGTLTTTSSITAGRAHYLGASPKVPITLAGTSSRPYTLIFPVKPPASQPTGITASYYPQGTGYATMTLTVSGLATVTAKLADHTAFTASSLLSKDNAWPVFAQLYALKGCIAGVASVSDNDSTTEDVAGGDFLWVRPFQATQWYPDGWTDGILTTVQGARYVVPPASPARSVFPDLLATVPNATMTFTDGLLTHPLNFGLSISPQNTVTNAPAATSPTTTITKASGVMTGSFPHTDGTKPVYQGVILQKGPNKGAWGYFQSTKPSVINGLGQSGALRIVGL